MESALFPPWLGSRGAPPPLSAQCLQPYLTCGSRGGGSHVSPQGQASDILDTPSPCPQPCPAQCGAYQAFAFSEPALGGCQFSGTGVRAVSFQKLGEPEGQRNGSVKPDLGFFFLSPFLRFFKDDPSFAKPAGLVRGRTALRCTAARAGGTEPRSPARAAFLPSPRQRGRLPGLAAAAEAAFGALGAA